MRRYLQRTRRVIGGFALAATLLAVFATVLHRHDEHDFAPVDCATCVVAHHAPATIAPTAIRVAPVEHVHLVLDAPAHVVRTRPARRALGRAPPRLPLAIIL